jgi:hypothetical protein
MTDLVSKTLDAHARTVADSQMDLQRVVVTNGWEFCGVVEIVKHAYLAAHTP